MKRLLLSAALVLPLCFSTAHAYYGWDYTIINNTPSTTQFKINNLLVVGLPQYTSMKESNNQLVQECGSSCVINITKQKSDGTWFEIGKVNMAVTYNKDIEENDINIVSSQSENATYPLTASKATIRVDEKLPLSKVGEEHIQLDLAVEDIEHLYYQ